MNVAVKKPANGAKNSFSGGSVSDHDLQCLRALERKVMWLSAWTIHNANHLRPSRDGVKVGGHQASSASLATIMTALYFKVLRPEDRVAVKPHASPVFHAIQYLFGNQTQAKLENFRGLGGAQSYPSRTKDTDGVDLSTGSVGLGGASTLFASIVQDYVRLHGLNEDADLNGRMVALFGDAELDEGNVFEALLEGWKHDARNLWWIIDYNRQSLDSIVTDRLFGRLDGLFTSMDWRVDTLKFGRLLEGIRGRSGGDALLDWIDGCPNQLYSALTFKGGGAWREHLRNDLGETAGIRSILDDHDDDRLHALMTNLAGHDMETLLDAFARAAETDQPTAFIAYTIKGHGLPLAGHKDNHAGLMTLDQMETFKADHGIGDGHEWEPFAGLELNHKALEDFLSAVPFVQTEGRTYEADKIQVPQSIAVQSSTSKKTSTQESFGRILNDLARGDSDLASRIVTTSPDVTVSTNLGPWVNQRQLFDRHDKTDTFRDEKVASAQKWTMSPVGQHIELGIAENNLFLMLGALGLSHHLFGARLLPIGTLYDPFIARGLDALNYASYQDSRYMLVATPSGISLAPEGGAHQSISSPLIGIGQPGLTYFEPAFADEVAIAMRWGFEHMQSDDGGSVYLRLSTRPLVQPDRAMTETLADQVIEGAYWLRQPTPGADLAIVYCGAVTEEAQTAHDALLEDVPGAGLLAVTSPDRLHGAWLTARRARSSGDHSAISPIEKLLGQLSPNAALVTVIDGHPATLSWLGAVRRQRIVPLGVEKFGQSGDIPDLYREYRLDADAILNAAATACLL